MISILPIHHPESKVPKPNQALLTLKTLCRTSERNDRRSVEPLAMLDKDSLQHLSNSIDITIKFPWGGGGGGGQCRTRSEKPSVKKGFKIVPFGAIQALMDAYQCFVFYFWNKVLILLQ